MSSSREKSLLRTQAHIFAPVVALIVLAFVVAFQFVDPAPPQTIKLATGSPGGAYALFGEAYKHRLAAEGIAVELLNTEGSTQNIELLASGEVDVAFVQGGIAESGPTRDKLLSLGSLYFEPMWVFHREPQPIYRLVELQGKRVAVGRNGSGTRPVALKLLQANGLTNKQFEQHDIGGQDAVDALLNNDLDALFVIASPRAEIVSKLLKEPGIDVMSFERWQAYIRATHYLSSVKLPQGVIDLSTNIPAQDKMLLAVTATLTAQAELHPALIDLLLQAASDIHGGRALFETHGQFPSPDNVEFALSPEAKRFYRSGPPFLQRYLPFWAATLVDRLWVMLLPFLALLIPLIRVMPPVYRWRIRTRIYKWYRQLLDIDPFVNEDLSTWGIDGRLAELTKIEHEVSQVNVPLSYADQLYHLRLHIDYVRGRLERMVNVDSP